MSNVITCMIAFGVIIGGLDQIFGNRRGYGEKFKEGFMMLGPTALSMAGIICLSNMIADGIEKMIAPFFQISGIDPSILAGFFSIDMGGYQLAQKLAINSSIGNYAAIVISATFGCTVVFIIPVGVSAIEKTDNQSFAKGIIIGLFCTPVTLLLGGALSGLSIIQILYQNIVIFIVSLFCGIGLWKYREQMFRCFHVYVKLINAILIIGLSIGALSHILNTQVIADQVSLDEAMKVVSSIGIILLGSLPLALFLQRVFEKPIHIIGKKLGLDAMSMTGLIIGCVSPIPTLIMLKDMNKKGKIINVAFLVSGTSVLGAHLGFVASMRPDMLQTLIISKFVGGIFAAAVAFIITKKEEME